MSAINTEKTMENPVQPMIPREALRTIEPMIIHISAKDIEESVKKFIGENETNQK